MKIYTKTGDQGETGVIGGRRVAKDHQLIQVCGDLDETNSQLGLARSYPLPPSLDLLLQFVQEELFSLGSRVADSLNAEKSRSVPIADGATERLENSIDQMTSELPVMDAFILPGGVTSGATLHLARTVCRRAERNLVALVQSGDVQRPLGDELIFLNRLSDWLFVAARWVNQQNGVTESKWKPNSK